MGLTVKQVLRQKEPGMYADGNGLYLQVINENNRSWILRYKRFGKHAVGRKLARLAVTARQTVPQVVRLQCGAVNDVRRYDEQPVRVASCLVGKPDEEHEVRPRVALEQCCPSWLLGPLHVAAQSTGLYGDANVGGASHGDQINGGCVHHPATVDVACGQPRNNSAACAINSPAQPTAWPVAFTLVCVSVSDIAASAGLSVFRYTGGASAANWQ
jgi:hypothetical protein